MSAIMLKYPEEDVIELHFTFTQFENILLDGLQGEVLNIEAVQFDGSIEDKLNCCIFDYELADITYKNFTLERVISKVLDYAPIFFHMYDEYILYDARAFCHSGEIHLVFKGINKKL